MLYGTFAVNYCVHTCWYELSFVSNSSIWIFQGQ